MRLIPPDRREEELEILSRTRRGERFDHFETIRLAKDGRQLDVSITVSPIKDSTGHVVGAVKVQLYRAFVQVSSQSFYYGAPRRPRPRESRVNQVISLPSP